MSSRPPSPAEGISALSSEKTAATAPPPIIIPDQLDTFPNVRSLMEGLPEAGQNEGKEESPHATPRKLEVDTPVRVKTEVVTKRADDDESDSEEVIQDELVKSILSDQMIVIWEVTNKSDINLISANAVKSLLRDRILPHRHGNPNQPLVSLKDLKQSIRNGLKAICRSNGFLTLNSLSTMSASVESVAFHLKVDTKNISDLVEPLRTGIRDRVDDIVRNPQHFDLDERRGAFWYNFVCDHERNNGASPLVDRGHGDCSPFVLFTTSRFTLP